MWNFLIGKPVANPALMRSRPEAGQRRGEGNNTENQYKAARPKPRLSIHARSHKRKEWTWVWRETPIRSLSPWAPSWFLHRATWNKEPLISSPQTDLCMNHYAWSRANISQRDVEQNSKRVNARVTYGGRYIYYTSAAIINGSAYAQLWSHTRKTGQRASTCSIISINLPKLL